ncbi:MAG: hypothetical protein H0W88_00100 [Parachlamydiaceae bacterium]|nr:hypothetical protein [Parachlamydiaceae bacterium]
MRNKKINVALAGGVNVLLSPWTFIINRKLKMLTPENMMKPFDVNATGHLNGEGAGLVLLKRLSDAIKDNDHIYGVMSGISVQHGGKSMYLTAPNPNSHREVIHSAYEEAGITPNDIDYIEAQGTADPMTDKMELAVYNSIFENRSGNPVTIGTIKGNMGHLGSASGITALIKAILTLKNNCIPKVLNFEQINWNNDEDGPLSCEICNETKSWIPRSINGVKKKRRIGIHNFGYGGVNGHIVLDEYAIPNMQSEKIGINILPISARTEKQLHEYVNKLLNYIKIQEYKLYDINEIRLPSLLYTLQTGKEPLKYRIAIVANNLNEFISKLELLLINKQSKSIFKSNLNISEGQFTSLNEIELLAEKWVQGKDVDWLSFYPNEKPAKIPLPSYAFEKALHVLSGYKSIQQANSSVNKINNTSSLKKNVINRLIQIYCDCTNLDYSHIDPLQSLDQYGIDSILITNMNERFSHIFGDLPKTLLFEFQTLDQLADYFLTKFEKQCMKWTNTKAELEERTLKNDNERMIKQKSDKKKENEPIAIIGISGRYPKAKNLKEYYKNLENGRNCITEIPANRWSLENFYEANKDKALKKRNSYGKWGGFLDNHDCFDPLFFNISPLEAINMDPQERQFLEVCWETLEDAGYSPEELVNKFDRDVGVFVGITKTGYELYGPDLWRSGETLHPRTSFGSVANRVSYVLNLGGPCMPIDTMCSSSLTAIHEACEHLLRDECKMAFAGGVNLYMHPSNFVELSSLQMLSTDGKCKSFGEGGNGFVPGEGVGAILLKRLSDALEDNDHIYGVIKGTSINHGGKTNGYTVPSPNAQADLVKKALDKAGLMANHLSCIEAHGTGTELGDPIEVAGLTKAFERDTQEKGFCSLGSVKTNIGHLEAAAGIAGVTKLVLQLYHKKLFPTLYAETPNSNINFAKTPFKIQNELETWNQRLETNSTGQKIELPRIGGISSFGAGGSNAHVIIEEYITTKIMRSNSGPYLILLSAKEEDVLCKKVDQLLSYLQEELTRDDSLESIAYTLQVGRKAMEFRLGFIVETREELIDKLHMFLSNKNTNNASHIYFGNVKNNKEGMSNFSNDEDFPSLIKTWLEKRKISSLAKLWVNGTSIDWNLLYIEEKPLRISLPTYPFNKERYNLPTPETKEQIELEKYEDLLDGLIEGSVSVDEALELVDIYGLR